MIPDYSQLQRQSKNGKFFETIHFDLSFHNSDVKIVFRSPADPL